MDGGVTRKRGICRLDQSECPASFLCRWRVLPPSVSQTAEAGPFLSLATDLAQGTPSHPQVGEGQVFSDEDEFHFNRTDGYLADPEILEQTPRPNLVGQLRRGLLCPSRVRVGERPEGGRCPARRGTRSCSPRGGSGRCASSSPTSGSTSSASSGASAGALPLRPGPNSNPENP